MPHDDEKKSDCGMEDIGYWQARYDKGNDLWTTRDINWTMRKFGSKLLPGCGGGAGGTGETPAASHPSRVLVPMCGRAADVVWLYGRGGRGTTVVGVEAVYEVAAQVFTDSGIKYTALEAPEVKGHVLKVSRKERCKKKNRTGLRFFRNLCDFFLLLLRRKISPFAINKNPGVPPAEPRLPAASVRVRLFPADPRAGRRHLRRRLRPRRIRIDRKRQGKIRKVRDISDILINLKKKQLCHKKDCSDYLI